MAARGLLAQRLPDHADHHRKPHQRDDEPHPHRRPGGFGRDRLRHDHADGREHERQRGGQDGPAQTRRGYRQRREDEGGRDRPVEIAHGNAEGVPYRNVIRGAGHRHVSGHPDEADNRMQPGARALAQCAGAAEQDDRRHADEQADGADREDEVLRHGGVRVLLKGEAAARVAGQIFCEVSHNPINERGL